MSASPWKAALASLGFTAVRSTPRVHRLDGVCFSEGEAFASLMREAPSPTDPLFGQLGRPGLWKFVTDPATDRSAFEFDLPRNLVSTFEPDDEEPENDLLHTALLEWALATRDGELPNGWSSPSVDEVKSYVPDHALNIRRGARARQASLIVEETRLALRIPLCHHVRPDLPVERTEWLRQVLLDAHNRWRLVRVGLLQGSDHLGAFAEIDLSGAPALALQGLVTCALDALRWVSLLLLEPISVLTDTNVSLSALKLWLPRSLVTTRSLCNVND